MKLAPNGGYGLTRGLGVAQDVSWVMALAGVVSFLCVTGVCVCVCVYAISTWSSCLPGLSVNPVKSKGAPLEKQKRMPVALEGEGASLMKDPLQRSPGNGGCMGFCKFQNARSQN